jgi:hypothetical protein
VTMSDLASVADDLVVYLRFHISSALRATDPEAIAVAADSACSYYQGVGICELLLDAEVDAFFHHMIRSARSRRWLLRRARLQPGFPDKLLKASNTRGLFAAIVANDFALAKEIAELSANSWNRRVEYEDDFVYAHLLHRVVAGDPPPLLGGILANYRRVLEDVETPRVRLCTGYLEASQDLALEAFVDLLEERRAEMETMKKTSVLATDELFAAWSAIYVEGLAWLRLLTRTGLETEAEYIFCPSLARVGQYAPFVADGLLD